MRYKARSFALMALLTVSILMMVSSCGIDTSTLAGSATIISEDEAQQASENAMETDSSEILYDASEFLADVPAWDGKSP